MGAPAVLAVHDDGGLPASAVPPPDDAAVLRRLGSRRRLMLFLLSPRASLPRRLRMILHRLLRLRHGLCESPSPLYRCVPRGRALNGIQ